MILKLLSKILFSRANRWAIFVVCIFVSGYNGANIILQHHSESCDEISSFASNNVQGQIYDNPGINDFVILIIAVYIVTVFYRQPYLRERYSFSHGRDPPSLDLKSNFCQS